MTTDLRLKLLRDARLFMRRPEAMERLAVRAESLHLGTDQLAHPAREADLVVRRGRIRLAEFLPDGREIGRSVLQAGSCCLIRADEGDFPLSMTTIMALGPSELWQLPPGTLAEEGFGAPPAAEVTT
jgi:hypothetical protein